MRIERSLTSYKRKYFSFSPWISIHLYFSSLQKKKSYYNSFTLHFSPPLASNKAATSEILLCCRHKPSLHIKNQRLKNNLQLFQLSADNLNPRKCNPVISKNPENLISEKNPYSVECFKLLQILYVKSLCSKRFQINLFQKY